MPPNSRQRVTQGRWRAIALSLLVHGLIVAAAVLGWFTWKHEPPESGTVAVQGTLVDPREIKGIEKLPEAAPEPVAEPPPEPEPEPTPEPEVEPPPPEEQGPPAPDPEELKRKEEERLAAEKQAQEKAEREKQEQLEREQQQRLEAEKRAAAKAAAEKAAAEKAAAEKRAAEKKKAEEAAAARKAAEEKARQAAEEELRRSLAAEERGNAARNSAEANRWHASIVARIERAWIKPASAVPGVTCVVVVSQVPGSQGGEVTSVKVSSCSVNDAALRESVEAAVLRASPLPGPPAGVPFERNLELTFAPSS
jgi:colicin import membrane protein